MSRSYISSPPQAPPWRVAGLLYFLLLLTGTKLRDLFSCRIVIILYDERFMKNVIKFNEHFIEGWEELRNRTNRYASNYIR
jgi:hypothetical protein